MPNVLTMTSTVICGHPAGSGGIVAVQSGAKLRVAGAAVLLTNSIKDKLVSGLCATVPSSGTKKCTTVSAVTAGSATKLKVRGEPVILDTLKGDTDGTVGGTPQKALSGVANQNKLSSV